MLNITAQAAFRSSDQMAINIIVLGLRMSSGRQTSTIKHAVLTTYQPSEWALICDSFTISGRCASIAHYKSNFIQTSTWWTSLLTLCEGCHLQFVPFGATVRIYEDHYHCLETPCNDGTSFFPPVTSCPNP